MVAFLAIEMFAVKLLLLLWLVFVVALTVVVVVVVANRRLTEQRAAIAACLAKFALLFAFVSRSVARRTEGKKGKLKMLIIWL